MLPCHHFRPSPAVIEKQDFKLHATSEVNIPTLPKSSLAHLMESALWDLGATPVPSTEVAIRAPWDW